MRLEEQLRVRLDFREFSLIASRFERIVAAF